MDTILTNIGQLCTPVGLEAQGGKKQGEILISSNSAIGIKNGVIEFVGSMSELTNGETSTAEIIDCGGKLVTPGLVDAHTHLVFGGWRQNELTLKLKGTQYLDILNNGGGILSTVEQTRLTDKAALIERGEDFLDEMLSFGVTSCEAKSGYGLSTYDEIKILKAIRELNELNPIDIVPTFMGAHAIPKEFSDNRQGYIDLIITEMLPKIATENLAEFCDVFCENSVFTPEESEMILTKAKELGLTPKIHADEIVSIGGAKIAADVGAISAEHLIMTSDEGIKKMAANDVVAVLLPATSFYLDKPYARAGDMITSDLPVAVATDFNPGSSPSLNLQLVMNLACLKYKMTPAEVLTAVTLNGAAAINRAEKYGSLEVGKIADIVIWNAPDLDYIFYRFGSNLVSKVLKQGEVMVDNTNNFR